MDEKSIHIIPFMGEEGKWCMWSVKFMAIYGIKRYDNLWTGDKKILLDETDETKHGLVTELNFLNKAAYNELILTQEDTFFFLIVEETKTKIISM